MPPERFAQIMVEDLFDQLPPSAGSIVNQISNAIRKQVALPSVPVNHDDVV